ncbi:GspE/PulE family protein [Lentisphaera profundi]|uniref:GspE/PulE family protein n=1 Tax=Lentisphaera profundi TaxID=1658616 RepID=A0ABY7VUZ2_9BACT|nr:GspE/PulE family protein [Lentisphaera profundi]WDE97109.1 GspE/PulE family protein [Lentisphaera profundi]
MIDLDKITFNPALVAMLPSNIALKKLLLPCTEINGIIYVIAGEPESHQPSDLKRYFGKDVKLEKADPKKLKEKIKLHYRSSNKVSLENDQNEVIRLTDEIIFTAVSKSASDIHINPKEDKVLIRFRVSGQLETYKTIPIHSYNGLISRIKILAEMNIAEKRSPQDGKLTYKVPGTHQKVDIRAASIPSINGEKMTLRLLGINSDALTLDKIGMSKQHLAIYHEEIQRDNGLILINGATGSGKSTSLYASLRHILKSKDVNIITVEDPVEYQVDNVIQVNVDESDKVSFPSALKSILRHDPDVIMIGEIRDAETAGIAIKSSLTGHLVLSSLHANSASAAVVRLADIGVEPYMIASTLRVSIAQKLVKKLCQNCCTSTELTEQQALLIKREDLAGTKVAVKKGCLYCGGLGYLDRMPILEVIQIDNNFKALIHSELNDENLRKEMQRQDIPSLVDDAISKMQEGLIDFQECYKIVSTI